MVIYYYIHIVISVHSKWHALFTAASLWSVTSAGLLLVQCCHCSAYYSFYMLIFKGKTILFPFCDIKHYHSYISKMCSNIDEWAFFLFGSLYRCNVHIVYTRQTIKLITLDNGMQINLQYLLDHQWFFLVIFMKMFQRKKNNNQNWELTHCL